MSVDDLMDLSNSPIKRLFSVSEKTSKKKVNPWYHKIDADYFSNTGPTDMGSTGKRRVLNNNHVRHGIRGWHGRTMLGRSVERPFLEGYGVLHDFDSVLLDIHKSNVKTGSSYTKLFRATVVVGNGVGVFGMGQGDAAERNQAVILARDNAAKCLYRVPLQEGTLVHRVLAQMNHLKVTFDPRPDGYGLRCHRMIKSICQVVGVKNLHARLLGNSRKAISIVKATVQALATQETHEELAERTGCYVVKTNPESFNLPEIIAIPSTEQIAKCRIRRREAFDYDFAKQLDPYLGLHRPRRVVLHDRTTTKWKKGKRRMRYIIREVLTGRLSLIHI